MFSYKISSKSYYNYLLNKQQQVCQIPKQIQRALVNLMNIFSGLQVYGGSWNVINSRGFEAGEIAAVKKAEVVSSEYGNSVCFYMASGGQTYIPLSTNSTLSVGDSVDLSKAKILTLHRDGNDDITRIEL